MAHEIEKLPVSAELLKCCCPLICSHHSTGINHAYCCSYYRTRVQESEAIVQDSLARLTCLEVSSPPPPPPPPDFCTGFSC